MARPTWRGAISFGLVNVPVHLFTAVRPQRTRFRQLHGDTGNPVRQQRVDAETGEEVPYDELVKGYEVADGTFVVVDPAELAELDPTGSRLIEIHDYVDQGEIDPVHYDRAYYLAPDGETAAKPYALLTQAMQRAGKVAIASFVMRNNEYLAAIRAVDGRLVLSTMHYSDEVADPAELSPAVDEMDVELRDREVTMAEQLIEAMTTGFCPTCYRNEHRARVEEYLEVKAREGTVSVATGDDRPTGEVIDLMAALERSLARSQDEGDAGGNGSSGPAADPAATDDDLEDLSRAELYERAQAAQVPGRSSMSKAELVAALRGADSRRATAS
jgi:DNA end-binding protein Ku